MLAPTEKCIIDFELQTDSASCPEASSNLFSTLNEFAQVMRSLQRLGNCPHRKRGPSPKAMNSIKVFSVQVSSTGVTTPEQIHRFAELGRCSEAKCLARRSAAACEAAIGT